MKDGGEGFLLGGGDKLRVHPPKAFLLVGDEAGGG
jgi:hypothetical protein